jgi:hypothetical protein
MDEINGYTIIGKDESLELNENITFWKCEKNNSPFKILRIKPTTQNNRRMLDRLLKNEIKPDKDDNFVGIQKVVETGWNDEKTICYIVYEDIDDYNCLKKDNSNASLLAFQDILTALNNLKINNRTGNAISPDRIFVNNEGNAKLTFVGLFEFFKEQNLLDEDYLPPNIINSKDCHPKCQDDIYSVIKSFEPFLRDLNDENANKILEKALLPNRTDRFSKYSDILDLAEKISYKPKFTKVLKIGMKPENRDEFTPTFEEVNRKCYMTILNERSRKDNDIMGYFSIDNWSGSFFVRRDRDEYIRLTNCKNEKHEKFIGIGNDWFIADFSFSFDDGSTDFKAFDFFNEKFRTRNQLAELNKTKTESVKKWQMLPDKEKEYIEENAFRVRYNKVEVEGTNASFFLDNGFNSWDKIKTLKNEEIIFYVNDVKIGKIGNFHSENNNIILKDILCDKQEIPEKGELYEDVRQKISQFKKQVEACQKFKTQNVVNPDICSILATPETAKIPDNDRIWNDDYDKFKDKVFDQKLKTDNTQIEAVLEALSYKPI